MVKEWRHIVRDRRTALLVMLSPVLFLVVLAYSFSIEIQDVTLAVMDGDRSPVSRAYVAALTDSGDLVACCWAQGYDDIEDWLLDGQARAAVVIPPGFMARLSGGGPAAVQVIVDGTDPNTAAHAIGHITSRTEAFGLAEAASVLAATGHSLGAAAQGVDLRVRTWYNPSLKYIVGMVPALIAVVLGMPAIAASLAITREKEWGTYEALIATPVGRLELLVGKLIPYVASGLVSAALCAAVGVYWFGVPFRGSFPTYLLLSTDFLLATLALGILISVLLSSQQAAMIVALLVFLFPGFFLSGIFIPLSAMGLMKMEAYMMPTTHFVLINRGLFVKGVGLDVLWVWGLALAAVATAALLVSVALFQKRL